MRSARNSTRWLLLWIPAMMAAGGAMLSAAPKPADAPWHFPAAAQRLLVRIWLRAGDAVVARPVTVALPADTMPAAGDGVRAWDLAADREVPAQLDSGKVFIDPGTPLEPGKERRYLVYLCPRAAATTSVVRMDESGRVETDGYIATVNRDKGGVISSLILKAGGKRVETLGDGIHWWVGRNPQITQESFGALPVSLTTAGAVFAAYRITYPNLLADGNSLVADYCFFRDFIELDYHYNAVHATQLLWFKLPVSLHAVGTTPGLFSNSQTRDGAMLTSGANKWIDDPHWHDVSYFGDQPFGMGVIARSSGADGLFYMDSGKPDEHEWIYAEPFGWHKPVDITADFDIDLTVVPHAAGKGRYVETLAKMDGDIGSSVSAWQVKGGPPIDSDGDGLPDLTELRLGTNPNCADTDGDGIPDGRDPDPLRSAPPQLHLDLPHFKAAPTNQPQTIAQVKPVRGVPTLVLDGKPYGPMTYNKGAATWEQLGRIADRDFTVYVEMVGSIGWPGNQADTFKRLDEHMSRFLEQVPNGRAVLRLYVCNPPHFARDYPNEVLRFNDGTTQHFTKWYAMTDRPLAERGYPSFASEIWRQKTAQALYDYVTHVRQSPYARNIIGYFVCGGGTEEWYYWGDYDHHKYCVDFSPPMLCAFRTYLRAKYDGDVTKLRAAWNDPTADFGTATPPGPEARSTADWGVFWDPVKSQRVRDYYYVHNKAMEDSILIFSRAVKEACNGEQLVGMFHGYLQNMWLVEGGQATLKDLLNSSDVDFWSGPPQYNRRGPGEHGCNRFLDATLKKHGKLWISESDIRTNFSEPSDHNPALYGRPPSLDESLACLKREFAHQLCEGENGWWFQMGREWYDHEPILSLFQQMQRCGETATRFDRTSDTDIAAVVDMESLMTGPPVGVSTRLLDTFKVQELCRIGSPVDFYELDDVLTPDAKHYKLYIMLNCFSLTDRERQLIDQRLRRDGATIVWMFAPGLFNPDKKPEMSLSHIKDLLGFGLDSETGSGLKVDMKLTAAGTAYFTGFDPQRVFGSFERPEWVADKSTGKVIQTTPDPTTLAQRFFGDAGGDVLARFVDGGGPSIVERHDGRSTDIWIGDVMAPSDLLRSIARRAGCHLFCDADEIIYADHSFLAIHTRAAGERNFHLRRKCDVVEVFSGQVMGTGITEFKDTIGAYRTRLYFIGDRARWDAECRRADAFFADFQKTRRTLREGRAAAKPQPPH